MRSATDCGPPATATSFPGLVDSNGNGDLEPDDFYKRWNMIDRQERYAPQSEFLRAIAAEEVPLSSGEIAEVNLRQLVAMTRDKDLSNRDWATFLLAREEIDTPFIRDALLAAANDESDMVRAEAVLGLAKRDPHLALPLIQKALKAETVTIPILEAATVCAHPSLIKDLRIWAQPSDDPLIDQFAADALEVCEKAAG